MTAIFVDAAFWIARTDPHDQWHELAVRAEDRLGRHSQLATTDEVLTEFLTALSNRRLISERRSRQSSPQLVGKPKCRGY